MRVSGTPSLTVATVFVDVEEDGSKSSGKACIWTPIPNSRYGLCGRKATLKKKTELRAQEMRVSGTPSLTVATVFVDVEEDGSKSSGKACIWTPIPNSRYGFCGRKATLKKKTDLRVQEMRVSGPPSLTVATVSVDVKQH